MAWGACTRCGCAFEECECGYPGSTSGLLLRKPRDMDKKSWYAAVKKTGEHQDRDGLDFATVGVGGGVKFSLAYDEANDKLLLHAEHLDGCWNCDNSDCPGCGNCLLKGVTEMTDSQLRTGVYVGARER